MIYGSKQEQGDNKEVWDYVACPFPQGHLSYESNIFFNDDHIKEVIFKGLESEGELVLQKRLQEVSGEGKK
ncbi:DUF4176 domain-containing protein [Oceanobacillus manasiensis]|uniref:DUF4176 domain-containing protein n=1 Tax=Oceanobacillus manasiensis TaxID=586413 RepID=UPI0005A6071D|nr:DUF4176 domain-containing protein [Oceanobacillus manasiensis]